MRDVGGEADPFVDPGDELVGGVEGDLADPAAAAADEVDVGGVLGEVVAGRAVVDVGVPDEAELLEGLERAVDRRGRHRPAAVGAHAVDDLVGRRVAEPADRGEDALALRGQALALRPQPLPEIAHPPNVCGSPAPAEARTYTDAVSHQGLDALEFTDDDPSGEPEPRPRRRRWLRRVLVVLSVLLLLVVGSVAAFVAFLGVTVKDNVKQEQLLPTDRTPVTDPSGKPVPTTGVGTNFLVIGSDTRSTSGQGGRADVIVLVHVPADPTSIQMIHFPRDLYVDIPGHGKNKINAAYAFGKEPLLVRTLENLLRIRIDHVARTDFEGFKGMTDAVGGVRVYAEEASDGSGNGGPVVIKKGWNTLDGTQALAFVRERYTLSEGDISRGRRQLAFIKALLLQATSRSTLTNPVKIANFTEAATKYLVVDQTLTVGDMKDYALQLRNIRGSDVVFATAPFSGFAMDPKAGSIDVVDTKRMALLGTALRTDTMDDYLDVFVTP